MLTETYFFMASGMGRLIYDSLINNDFRYRDGGLPDFCLHVVLSSTSQPTYFSAFIDRQDWDYS